MDKKGVSLVLSYVILILIVLTLAGITYAWLKFRIPKDIKECSEDISLIIKNVDIDSGKREAIITFQNKGFFTADGVLLRYAKDDYTQISEPINNFEDEKGNKVSYYTVNINPGDTKTIGPFYYKIVGASGSLTKIELIPFIYEDETNEPILCEDAKIVYSI